MLAADNLGECWPIDCIYFVMEAFRPGHVWRYRRRQMLTPVQHRTARWRGSGISSVYTLSESTPCWGLQVTCLISSGFRSGSLPSCELFPRSLIVERQTTVDRLPVHWRSSSFYSRSHDALALTDSHPNLSPAGVYEYLSNLFYQRRTKMNPVWNACLVGGWQKDKNEPQVSPSYVM